MYNVYILKSKNNNRYYIGCTQDVDLRLYEHNKGKVSSTKTYRPWKIVYIEKFISKDSAYLKS